MMRNEKMRLLWQFAKEKNRIAETKIVLGLEDYETVARQSAISKETIRKRVARLIDDFDLHYEELS